MNKQDIKNKILAVLATLDKISVAGRDNVRHLDAVMDYLQRMAEEVTQDDAHDEQGADV